MFSFQPFLIEHFRTVEDILRLVVDELVCSGTPGQADVRRVKLNVRVVADVEIIYQLGYLVIYPLICVGADVESSQSPVVVKSFRPLLENALSVVVPLSPDCICGKAYVVERLIRELLERVLRKVHTVKVRESRVTESHREVVKPVVSEIKRLCICQFVPVRLGIVERILVNRPHAVSAEIIYGHN